MGHHTASLQNIIKGKKKIFALNFLTQFTTESKLRNDSYKMITIFVVFKVKFKALMEL